MSLFDRLSRRRRNQELDDEIQAHLAMAKQDRVERGETPAAAEMAARREFGNHTLIKEVTREMWGWNAVDHVFQDIRLGVRGMRRNPGFTLVAVLTLALGIGAATMIFSVVDNTVLNPAPYLDQSRIVSVFVVATNAVYGRLALSVPEFLDYAERSQVFDGIFGVGNDDVLYRTETGTEQFRGFIVTPNTFEFYHLPPLFGRTFTPEDGAPDAPPVFVMSQKLWTERFGADPSILNQRFVLNGVSRTLIGIMPRRLASGADLWIPWNVSRYGTALQAQNGSHLSFILYGHLKPHVSRAEADADLNLLGHQLAPLYPNAYPKNFAVRAFPYSFVSDDSRSILLVTLAATGLVLLIGCGNVGNLMLARAITREKEFAIQVAMGASRIRVIRQLLLESLLLASAGVAIGWSLASGGLKILLNITPASVIPPTLEVTLNHRALVVSIAITVLSVLIFGLAPSLQVSRRNIEAVLRQTGRGGGGGLQHGRMRTALVVGEVALVLTLMSGTGLMIRAFLKLTSVSLGIDPDHILMIHPVLPQGREKSPSAVTNFYRPLLVRLAALPGVGGVAIANAPPPLGGVPADVDIPGKTHSEKWTGMIQLASEDYFSMLHIPFIQGRSFTESEVYGLRKVMVINQTFAKTYLCCGDPTGAEIRLPNLARGADQIRDPSFEVIGVVADIRNQGPQQPAAPAAWIPYTITNSISNRLVMIRSAGQDPLTMINAVRHEIWAIDPTVAPTFVFSYRTLDEYLGLLFYSQPRFAVIMLSIFAGLGLALATVGVYSVISYNTERQTHEIGIRMALGARPSAVFGYVVGGGMRLIAAGTAIGLIASFVFIRVMRHMPFGSAGGRINISANEPTALASVVGLLLMTGLAALWIPARRAARVDPAIALRDE